MRRNEIMRASIDWEIKRTRSTDKAANIREAFLLKHIADNHGSGKMLGFGESIRDIANFNNNLFARLPSESNWIKSGAVERQTTATHVPWQHRLMILTTNHVIFSKSGSDTAVDQISFDNITFVGAVEGEDEQRVTATLSKTRDTSANTLKNRRRNAFGQTNDGLEGMGKHFMFEIITETEGRERSYFCRVDSAQECDDWISSIESARAMAVSGANSEHAHFFTRLQVATVSPVFRQEDRAGDACAQCIVAKAGLPELLIRAADLFRLLPPFASDANNCGENGAAAARSRNLLYSPPPPP